MSWDGKSKGGKSGYAIFVWLLKHGGLGAAYFLLNFVALYYVLFSWKKSKTSFYFYKHKIGYNNTRVLRSVYRNYYKFGQTLIDKVAVMANLKINFTFTFEGEEYLHQMAGEGKGGILVGAHLGNWEIAGHYLERIDVPINIIMYDNEYQQIKEYLDSVTGDKNYAVIAIKDDFSHIYKISEALSKNEFICLHADRHFDNSKVIYHPFLNNPAPFSEAIFRLCTLFKTPVTFVYAFKKSNKHYHFYATQPKVYTGNKNEKASVLLNDFVTELENKVKQYPLHWFNFYNFWQH